jgi:hypothetical protein
MEQADGQHQDEMLNNALSAPDDKKDGKDDDGEKKDEDFKPEDFDKLQDRTVGSAGPAGAPSLKKSRKQRSVTMTLEV